MYRKKRLNGSEMLTLVKLKLPLSKIKLMPQCTKQENDLKVHEE
jgi:hypothetical protein